nr:olfactory receptor 37 [Tropidothorax elegans]
MWEYKQLQWLAAMGWWPTEHKDERINKLNRLKGYFLCCVVIIEFGPELFSIITSFRNGVIDLAILNSNQMIIGVEFCIKLALFLMNKKKVECIMKTTKAMDDSARHVLTHEEVEAHTRQRHKVCDFLVVILYTKIFVVAIWITRPVLMLAVFGDKQNLIDSWTPFDTSTISGWMAAFVIQAIHIISAILGFIIIDCIVFCMLQMYLLQIDYLKCMFTSLSFKKSRDRSSIKLRYCIKFHQTILLLGKIINDLLKYVILGQAIIATIIICLSVFEFSTIKSVNLIRRTLTLIVALFQTYIVLVYCLFCQDIEQQNEKIIRAAYCNDWYIAKLSDKKNLLFLMQVSQKNRPIGFIVSSNINLFIAVMKTTFSYYQFLDTMVE